MEFEINNSCIPKFLQRKAKQLINIPLKTISFKLIDRFSDLKTLNISKETKIYRHSWKQCTKISITAKFQEEIL